jgi:mannose-6-phosphate isomerase-like protein (cupin superfamily)
MSDYTHRNLKADVADSAVEFGLAPDLEAHFGARDLNLENSGVSYQRLAPNYRGGFGHRHKQQEELYVVIGGGGRIKLGDDVVELKRLDAVRIPAGTMRALEAGPEGIELIAYGAPATGPGDAEVEQDWWPRT